MPTSQASMRPKLGRNNGKLDEDSGPWKRQHDNYEMHTNMEYRQLPAMTIPSTRAWYMLNGRLLMIKFSVCHRSKMRNHGVLYVM